MGKTSRHRKLEELFDAALRLHEGERQQFIQRECTDDWELREELDALLAAYAMSTGNFLAHLADDHSATTRAPRVPVNASEETAIALPLPGELVGHYVIKRELGRGGMGAVYLARDTRLDRYVAIKFLLDVDATAERFMIEARALARCTHENIIVIHEVAEHGGSPFMVLEYQEGETLRERLQAQMGRISVEAALEFMIPVVRALVCAHRAGIVHRDLKPENILVTESGRIKVLDFGIAKLFFQARQVTRLGHTPGRDMAMTRRGAILGTMPYMSPEQWGIDEVDQRSDIWAVGVMLFEMVVGQHPLAPLTPDALLQVAQLHRPMPKAQAMAPEIGPLADIIDRCLIWRYSPKMSRFPATFYPYYGPAMDSTTRILTDWQVRSPRARWLISITMDPRGT